jgi:hypothetical protein
MRVLVAGRTLLLGSNFLRPALGSTHIPRASSCSTTDWNRRASLLRAKVFERSLPSGMEAAPASAR